MTSTSEHSLLIDGTASRSDDLDKFYSEIWPLTKAHDHRFLFSSQNPNHIFSLTLFRIWLAYELGVQQYGVFSAEKR